MRAPQKPSEDIVETVVEAGARALAEKRNPRVAWEDLPEHSRHNDRLLARAAINAALPLFLGWAAKQ